MSDTGLPDLDLRIFLRILRRRLWVIVLVPALVTGAAYLSATRKTELYRSSAEILIARTEAETIFSSQLGTYVDPNRLLANQVRVIGSQEVATLASQRLGFSAGVGASASKTEDVITLSAVDREPQRVAAVVNAYADAYLMFRRSSSAAQNAVVQAELRRQIDPAEARLKELDDIVNRLPAASQDTVRNSQTNERQLLLGNLATQKAQLAQLQAAANVDKGGAQLLAPAAVPGTPFEPNPRRSAMLGLAVGIMLALGLALLLDYLDNRLRGKEDLERAGRGLPVVGVIPTLAGWRDRNGPRVAAIEEPASTCAEAYRSLRTALLFLSLDRSMSMFQLTSPATSEGKTTTLVNLAVVLARAGQRVVVVDCDLRRPRVHQFFDVEPVPGFTSVLMGEVSLSQALVAVPGVRGLRLLPAGPVPPNPSELLASRRTSEILAALKGQADIVLVDSPPVLPVSDATVLSSSVDGTIVVASSNVTQRRQLARALELLRQVEASVIGTVLNQAKVGGVYGYYGYRRQGAAKKYVASSDYGDTAKRRNGRRSRGDDGGADSPAEVAGNGRTAASNGSQGPVDTPVGRRLGAGPDGEPPASTN